MFFSMTQHTTLLKELQFQIFFPEHSYGNLEFCFTFLFSFCSRNF